MNLSNYSTFIVDPKPTSEYFRISEMKDTLSGGKNGFLIEGSEYLKETTEIKIEILDVAGNPIYFEPGNGIPEYYEGISKLIAVHVYDDTPIGVGKITILGELKNYIAPNGAVTPVPEEWKNTYNVKWEKTFTVNKNLLNEDTVRFYKRPTVSIDEIIKPIFSKVTPSITQSGSVQGISQSPIAGTDLAGWRAGTTYKLRIIDNGNFTSSIDENVINIPSLGYSPTVKEVLNSKEVLVDIPYSVNNIVSNFDSAGYTSSFEYVEGQTVTDSSLTGSFAKINVQQLKTFVGDVARVKIFRKSRNEVGDYQFVQESKLEASELLRDVTTTSDTQISYGNFTDTNLSTYWVTSSNDHPLTIDVEKLNASVKVDYNTTLGGVQQLITSESFSISKDVEYTVSFKTLLSGSLDGSKTIKAYLSSSDYQQTFLTVSGSDIYKTRQTVSQNILATNTSDAKLVFEFEGSDWYVSNVSLQNAQETSFSPDEFILIQDVPRKLAQETFDYRFEFYDINNNYIPVDVLGSHTFTGGNNFSTSGKLLTFESDRTAFRFSTGSVQNPPNQQIKFTLTQNNLSGSVTYASSAFDVQGNFLNPNEYNKYPGELTSVTPAGAVLTINNFTGSRIDGFPSPFVGSIVYTASVDDLVEYETVYRLEDGENAPGLFVTSDANQFIYKATDLSPNPTDQKITILAKRKNLASSVTPIIVNGVGGSPLLTELGTNSGTGITSYSLDITDFNYSIPAPSASYFFTASDEWGNLQYDTVTISQVKVLDGLAVSLTNENASLSALSTGFVASGSFIFTSGSVSVKVGSEDIVRQEGLSTNNRWDIISATGTFCTPNDGTPDDATYGITALSADSASLELLIRYKDGGGDITDITKVVSYSKVKKSAPLLNFAIGNGNQTVTAKSTGEQIDSFVNVSFAVNETYNGLTSTKTFTPTSITATNSYTGWTATATTLSLPNMVNGTDSVDLSITGSVVDSENTTRFVYGNVSLAKTKKAVPNVVISATPQSQTVSANPAGAQTGTLSNVSVSAVEGSTSRFTSMVISGTSGFSTAPTVSGSTLTMTSAVMNSDEASVTLTVTHTDSEGTTGQTKTIIIRASKIKQGESGVVVNLNPASQVVTVSNTGVYGTPASFVVSVVEGSTTYTYDASAPYSVSSFRISGLSGGTNSNATITPTTPTSVSGTNVTFNVIYTNTSGVEVTIPSSHKVSVTLDGQTGPGVVHTGPWVEGRAYQFSTGAGTGRRDVVLYPASGTGTYYAATAQHTSTATGVTGPPTVGSYWESLGNQDFFVAAKIGLFEDSYVQSTLNIGTNNSGGVSTANITLAGGTQYPYFSLGQVTAGVYNANGIYIGSDSGVYKMSLKGGSNSLTWDGSTLGITGTITSTSGTIGGFTLGGSQLYTGTKSSFASTASGVYIGTDGIALGSSSPFKVTSAGALTATSANITGVITATSGTFTGTINASGGTFTGYVDAGGVRLGVDVNGTNDGIYINASNYWYNNGYWAVGDGSTKGLVWNGSSLTIGGDVNIGGSLASALQDSTEVNNAEKTAGKVGGWQINSNRIYNTNVNISNSDSNIEFKDSGGTVRTRIKFGDVNIGSPTAYNGLQIFGAGSSASQTVTSNYSPNQNYSITAQATDTTTASSNTLTLTNAGAGSKVLITINIPAIGSFGTAGGGSGYNQNPYGTVYLNYTITCAQNGYNSGPKTSLISAQNSFSPSAGAVSLSVTTGVDGVVGHQYVVTTSLTRSVTMTVSGVGGLLPGGVTASASVFSLSAANSNFTIAAIQSIAEYGTNGASIGSDDGTYVSFGKAAGPGYTGLFTGNVFVGGTLYAAQVSASDSRVKTNVLDITNGIQKIKALRPVDFQWIEDINPYDIRKRSYGFIADEVEEIFPQLVFEKKNNEIEDFKHLDYQSFHGLSIKAIQELISKVESMESKISELENKISGSI